MHGSVRKGSEKTLLQAFSEKRAAIIYPIDH